MALSDKVNMDSQKANHDSNILELFEDGTSGVDRGEPPDVVYLVFQKGELNASSPNFQMVQSWVGR